MKLTIKIILSTFTALYASITFSDPATLISGHYDNPFNHPLHAIIIEGVASSVRFNDRDDGRFFIRMPTGKSSTILFTRYIDPENQYQPTCIIQVKSYDENHAFVKLIKNYNESELKCKISGDVNNDTAKLTVIKEEPR